MTWAATQAKAKFSEVLDLAEAQGLQLVRRRKQNFVLLTEQAYEESVKRQKTEETFVNAWEATEPSFGQRLDVEVPRLTGKLRTVDFA